MTTLSTLERATAAERIEVHRQQLNGVWRNQLGSELVVHADTFGALTGSFRAAGGHDQAGHAVTGSYDVTASGDDCVLAFTVRWPEAHGVTVWAGRFRHEDGTLVATWLMTSDLPPEEEWRSTLIGHDVFERVAPA